MRLLFLEIKIVTGEWSVDKAAKKSTWVVTSWRLFEIKKYSTFRCIKSEACFCLKVNCFATGFLKETRNSPKKSDLLPFGGFETTPLWKLEMLQNLLATFKNFLHLSYKNTYYFFCVTLLFNIFMRQTLTDDRWFLGVTIRVHKVPFIFFFW